MKENDRYKEFYEKFLELIIKDFSEITPDKISSHLHSFAYIISEGENKIQKQNQSTSEELFEEKTKELKDHLCDKRHELNQSIKLTDIIAVIKQESKECDMNDKEKEKWE